MSLDDFIQFMATAAQTPRLALAFIENALISAMRSHSACIALGICALGGFVILRHRWQRRRHKDGMEWTELLMSQATIRQDEETFEEDAFNAWWLERHEESGVLVTEEQARRLYDAYQKNKQIILMQRVASEVVE